MNVRRLSLVLALAACSNTAGSAIDASSDAAATSDADVIAMPEVGGDATVLDAATGPIDGVWRVTDILCNGMPGSDAARLYITEPNRSSFEVRGERSVYTLTTSTCTQRLTSTVTYPSAGSAVFTAAGPFTCTPVRCSPACDTTPTLPYVYTYQRRGDGLVMTTVGATPDVTCTAYGQSNPITYTYAPVP